MMRTWPLLLAVLVSACAGRNQEAPARSPAVDYPLPPAQTSDGEVVGADRMPPEDKLRQGPRAGSTGVVPAETPSGVAPPEQATKPQPCREIGLEDESGKSRCKKPSK